MKRPITNIFEKKFAGLSFYDACQSPPTQALFETLTSSSASSSTSTTTSATWNL